MKKHLKKAATVLACTGMVAGAFTTTAFAEDAEQITLNVSHIFVDQTDGQCRGWYKALDEYKEYIAGSGNSRCSFYVTAGNLCTADDSR